MAQMQERTAIGRHEGSASGTRAARGDGVFMGEDRSGKPGQQSANSVRKCIVAGHNGIRVPDLWFKLPRSPAVEYLIMCHVYFRVVITNFLDLSGMDGRGHRLFEGDVKGV